MNNRKSTRYAIIRSLLIPIVLPIFMQSSVRSQNQTPSDTNKKDDEQVIRCLQEYVAMVKVEVRDKNGKEVADLGKDDFIIYEDGVKQEMIFWRRNVRSDSRPDQATYEAGYYPMNSRFEGEWRTIRVFLRGKDKRKLKAEFTPKGYYAKEELRK